MFSASSRGSSSRRPRSMKPNCRAPACRYSVTWPGCAYTHMSRKNRSQMSSVQLQSTHQGSLWHVQHRARQVCSMSHAQQYGPMISRLTRLKATATGAPLWAASSAVCSSAQLSRARWSRDILMEMASFSVGLDDHNAQNVCDDSPCRMGVTPCPSVRSNAVQYMQTLVRLHFRMQANAVAAIHSVQAPAHQ
jgi:hypothetical protein